MPHGFWGGGNQPFTKKNPVSRREKVARSPQRLCSNTQTLDLSQNKRRRSEDEESTLEEIQSMLVRAINRSMALGHFIEKTPNKKREIKNADKDIRWNQECVMNLFQELIDMPQKNQSRSINKETKSIGIQTDLTIEKEEAEDIREQIEAGKDSEYLAKIIDKEWREEDYQTLHQTVGNPLKSNLKNNVAIFVDPNETGERGIVKELMERYPEIREIIEEGFTEGKSNTL